MTDLQSPKRIGRPPLVLTPEQIEERRERRRARARRANQTPEEQERRRAQQREAAKAWRARNPELAKQRNKEFLAANPEWAKANQKKRTKKHYHAHREQEIARKEKWRLANHEEWKAYRRKHYAENKERLLERRRQQNAERRDEINAKERADYAKDPAKAKADSRRWRVSNVEKLLWLRARARAAKPGVAFEITLADVILPKDMLCPVLGIPLAVGEGGHCNGSPSLDRISNAEGYVPGNVRVISDRANRLKKDGTLEEFRALVRYLEHNPR